MPNKIRHDRNVRAALFQKNDYAWILDTAKLKGVSKKLSNRWKGPYRITDVIDDANFKVRTINGKKTLVVNKCKLRRCFERKILLDQKQETLDESQQGDNTDKLANLTNKLSTFESNTRKKSKKSGSVGNNIDNQMEVTKTSEKIPNNVGDVDGGRPKRLIRKPDRYQA